MGPADRPTDLPVHYHEQDYATTRRRLVALFVDLIVFLFLVALCNATLQVAVVPENVRRMSRSTKHEQTEKRRLVNKYMRPYAAAQAGIFFGVLLVYHVGLRRLRGGTAGYRIAGVRLVDEYGGPPGWKRLLKRTLIAVPFVLLFGASYFEIRKSPRRQSFHDELGGTWVVRKRAEPAGVARIVPHGRLLGSFMIESVDVHPADEAEEASEAADEPTAQSAEA